MSKIILFSNQKGGIGKSCCTLLAANALSQEPFNKEVLVIDTDKQKSIAQQRIDDLRGYDGATPYRVESMTVTDFFTKGRGIYKADEENDFVFIDVAGKLDSNLSPEEQEITKYISVADFLFIPFLAGGFQMNATMPFLKVALKIRSKRKKSNRPLKVYGFINMFESRTLDVKFLIEEIDDLRDLVNINFLESKLNRYALFRSTDTLTTFYESEPKGNPEKNLKNWFDEIYKIIK